MKNSTKGPLADSIELYLAHKRSLGKELAKVEPMLLLLDGYLFAHGVAELQQITASHIDAFVASRPRHSPRSYNGLIGTLRGLFDWMVVHEVLPVSPLRCETRRVTPPSAAIPLQSRPGAPSPRSCGTTPQQPAGADARRNLQDDFCPAVRLGTPRRGGLATMPQGHRS